MNADARKNPLPSASEEDVPLYKPWKYLQYARSYKYETQRSISHQTTAYNLVSENPGDRVPMHFHDKLVDSTSNIHDVLDSAEEGLPQLPKAFVAMQSKLNRGFYGSNKRSFSVTPSAISRIQAETPSLISDTNLDNREGHKRVPFKALNPIRYKLFLDQLTSQRSKHKKQGLTSSANVLSLSNTSLLPSTRPKPTPSPWIGFSYNLKRTDPVVFSPVLVTNTDLLNANDTLNLMDSHRYSVFTQKDNKFMPASLQPSKGASTNVTTMLSQANESLELGTNTMRTCRQLIERSSSKRASSVIVFRSTSNSTHHTDTDQNVSGTNSPYDSFLLEFANDSAPFSNSPHRTPHQRALMKAQQHKIMEMSENLVQEHGILDMDPPSFANYYMRSRTSPTVFK